MTAPRVCPTVRLTQHTQLTLDPLGPRNSRVRPCMYMGRNGVSARLNILTSKKKLKFFSPFGRFFIFWNLPPILKKMKKKTHIFSDSQNSKSEDFLKNLSAAQKKTLTISLYKLYLPLFPNPTFFQPLCSQIIWDAPNWDVSEDLGRVQLSEDLRRVPTVGGHQWNSFDLVPPYLVRSDIWNVVMASQLAPQARKFR